MQYKAYTNKSASNVVSKTLIALGSGECEIKGDSSIMRPRFTVTGLSDGVASRLNYIYIPDWKRYYYVEDIIATRGRGFEIVCKSDPLMTFASEIRGITTVIRRQEFKYNDYIPDPMIMSRATRRQFYKKIGDLGEGAFYITVNH